jgi:FkbM family methyltransferase
MDIFINSIFYNEFRKTPIKLVDVGASGGLQEDWRAAGRFLQIIGFEPDKEAYEELKKTDGIYLNSALYNEKKELDFFLTKKQMVSSIYQPNREFLNKFPNSERFDILRNERISCDSLDNQLKINGISDVDFIKLDTQGSELDILHGAKKTLDSVFGLEIEVEFSHLYDGQALFSDVDSFVRECDFQLFDLKPHYWKRRKGVRYGKGKGQIIFADALYLKKTELLNAKKSKILRAIAISLLYGYFDYAFEIYEFFNSNKSIFSEAESTLIADFFKKTPSRIPDFKGKGKIASLIEDIAEGLRPNTGWGRKAGKLGNL